MKKIYLSGLFAFMLGAGVLMAADKKEEPKKDDAPAKKDEKKDEKKPGKPVNVNCAVQQDEKADPTVTYIYQGKTYAFCCKDCIDDFKKNPEKYKNAK